MDLVDAETSGRGDGPPGLFVCIYRPTMDELRQKKTAIVENELDKLRAQIASLEDPSTQIAWLFYLTPSCAFSAHGLTNATE